MSMSSLKAESNNIDDEVTSPESKDTPSILEEQTEEAEKEHAKASLKCLETLTRLINGGSKWWALLLQLYYNMIVIYNTVFKYILCISIVSYVYIYVYMIYGAIFITHFIISVYLITYSTTTVLTVCITGM